MSQSHQPCPDCGSSDALQINDDGSTKCYSCEKFTPASDSGSKSFTYNFTPITGVVKSIPDRGLTKDACQKYNYRVGKYKGKDVHIATYRDSDGNPVFQKIRYVDSKEFFINGKFKPLLYGQHLYKGYTKKLIIVEGEIDCLSVWLAIGNYPVVSLPNGAAKKAKNAIKHNLKWIEQFDEVVLMFDMDEPGQKAAKECAELISIGKAKIAHLPMKDANEMLQAGRIKELVDATWRAEEFRPDGIVSGDDILNEILTYDVEGFPYPFKSLNKKLQGIRTPSLVLIGAGTGVGKSLFMREIAYHFMIYGEKIGYIALEESVARTGINFIGFVVDKLLHAKPDELDDEAKKEIFDGYFRDKLYLYKHFGSLDSESLINKIRYMKVGLGCKYVFLDHLSIVISGSAGADERKDIDRLVTALRSLVEEVDMAIITACHLTRPQNGKAHEEGGRVTLGSFRGSGAIAQLSDDVIGLERDQQSESNSDRTDMRVLKNRLIGDLGLCDNPLDYNRETGRLTEVERDMDEIIDGFSDSKSEEF